jgi:hypothetical protein
MSGELGTTNLLLGIIAAVSVVEVMVLAGMGIAGFLAVRRVMNVVAEIETRQVVPAMARVHAILDDVHGVTSRVREETERVDQAIHTTIDRLDDTADRVRSTALAKASHVLGVIRGLRDVVAAVMATRHA